MQLPTSLLLHPDYRCSRNVARDRKIRRVWSRNRGKITLSCVVFNAHRSSSGSDSVRRGEPWSKKKLELEAARVVLIERMHLPIKLKKKLITILSECILIKESRRTMRGGI